MHHWRKRGRHASNIAWDEPLCAERAVSPLKLSSIAFVASSQSVTKIGCFAAL
jgi:hypothetical protein